MAVYRVNKNRGYTVMANYHLRDKTLSLKAVGLLQDAVLQRWLAVLNERSFDDLQRRSRCRSCRSQGA